MRCAGKCQLEPVDVWADYFAEDASASAVASFQGLTDLEPS